MTYSVTHNEQPKPKDYDSAHDFAEAMDRYRRVTAMDQLIASGNSRENAARIVYSES